MKKNKSADLPLFLEDFQAEASMQGRRLPLFLEDFLASTEPRILTQQVSFSSVTGRVQAFWARPDISRPLPAVLLVFDDDTWSAWMKTSTRELASIGYEVLTVNLHARRVAASQSASRRFTDEAVLADLSASVRWLRGRSQVLPNHLGVVGWGWSGGQVLALASALPLQACIFCDSTLPRDPEWIMGLRETPLLAVFADGNLSGVKELSAFRECLSDQKISCKVHIASNVLAGFMNAQQKKPVHPQAAEEAWVEIYHFLEKHVEDARTSDRPVRPANDPADTIKPVATIADMMRAVNEPAGVRGALSRALEERPADVKQWQRIRAHAALMAEAGIWLQKQPAPKGSSSHWQEQSRAYTAAAEAIVDAANRRDHPAAQKLLLQLAGQCAACHNEHR